MIRNLLPKILAVLTILLPLGASLVANRLFTAEDAARDYCIKSMLFKESDIKYLGSTKTSALFGSEAKVEFKVAGTEPIDSWVIHLKRRAYFLPWRAEKYEQKNYRVP